MSDKVIAIAGTFDRLHKGHRYFISEAFKLGSQVIIGLTSDEMANEKIRSTKSEIRKNIKIQNFQLRKKALEEFLRRNGLLERAEIVMINDVYGPATKDSDIEALIVTEETLAGGKKVNLKRKELGRSPLKLLKLPMILAEDKKRIASTRIRIGEIDRWGKVFESRITINESRINEELRQELKKPLGKLIKGDPKNLEKITSLLKESIRTIKPVIIITVGDEVTRLGNKISLPIHLAVVDYRVGRQKKYKTLAELGFKRKAPDYKVTNPAGHITKSLVEAIRKSYLSLIKQGRGQIIEVDGEEDLAGLPAVLFAPLGGVVLYGQPERGVVLVEVTEGKKQELLKLIENNI